MFLTATLYPFHPRRCPTVERLYSAIYTPRLDGKQQHGNLQVVGSREQHKNFKGRYVDPAPGIRKTMNCCCLYVFCVILRAGNNLNWIYFFPCHAIL